ncbi:MAG: enoyl-CoA hydratase/isomerase family protein [Actinobacteria bacterium]|nr:enoyl-CoA hydratase/isomerase family protein [Actinomycetota bacterium]MDI6830115.1 enoyl-CoA hydratase-related protein [Actinomycetota bacterium]
MDFKYLLVETDDEGIATIRLNRPEAKNALNLELIAELGVAADMLARDEGVRAVIVTGGEDNFAAGGDIKEMAGKYAPDMLNAYGADLSGFEKLERIPKPVVAAVSGYALGGGTELALVCDMIVASETAVFGMPEITLGIIPGAGGTQRLPRLVGPNRAKEMIFTGSFYDARTCLEMGLVNKVVPVEELMAEARELARRCIRNGAVALACAKACVNEGMNLDLYSGLAYERKCFSLLFSTEDQKEGMAAFKEKRKPQFRGR